MGHPNKRRKGKRRWNKLGFLIFYVLFLSLAIGLRSSSVNADSDEAYMDSSANPSNITIRLLNMYSNITGKWLIKWKFPNPLNYLISLGMEKLFYLSSFQLLSYTFFFNEKKNLSLPFKLCVHICNENECLCTKESKNDLWWIIYYWDIFFRDCTVEIVSFLLILIEFLSFSLPSSHSTQLNSICRQVL